MDEVTLLTKRQLTKIDIIGLKWVQGQLSAMSWKHRDGYDVGKSEWKQNINDWKGMLYIGERD